MNNSVSIAYRFELTLQLCLFDGSKPKNNDEHQPRLSNFFKNFDSNGGDDLCYQGGLDQSSGRKVRWFRESTPHFSSFQQDAIIELPKCVCNASESFKKHNQLLKLMQFLMGLDDSYMQIRSSILSKEVLPDVRSAYATISSEESHRVVVGSIDGSSQRNQASAFASNVPYS
ncbi:hypothetical protein Tco_0601138 [Tanacetum coccineum]